MQEMQLWSLGLEDALEEETAIHSSVLVWKIPWTLELGGLQSKGSQRVRHDWTTEHAHMTTCISPFPTLNFSLSLSLSLTHTHTHTLTLTHTLLYACLHPWRENRSSYSRSPLDPRAPQTPAYVLAGNSGSLHFLENCAWSKTSHF